MAEAASHVPAGNVLPSGKYIVCKTQMHSLLINWHPLFHSNRHTHRTDHCTCIWKMTSCAVRKSDTMDTFSNCRLPIHFCNSFTGLFSEIKHSKRVHQMWETLTWLTLLLVSIDSRMYDSANSKTHPTYLYNLSPLTGGPYTPIHSHVYKMCHISEVFYCHLQN